MYPKKRINLSTVVLRTVCALGLSLALGVSFADAASEGKSTSLIGKVYDNETRKLIYQEEHRFAPEKITTLYIDADGQQIAERSVTLSDDRVMLYELSQPGIEFEESIERGDDALIFKRRLQGDTESKELKPDAPQNVVIDAGFTNFILRNWDDLLAGKKIKADFASAAKLDVYRLQLRRVDANKSSMAKYGDPDGVVMFEMNIANPLIRMLLSPIEVGYFEGSKQLAYYQGISNLKDESGEQIDNVHVLFENVGETDSVALIAP